MPYMPNYNIMNPQQQYANYFTQPMQQQIGQIQNNVISGKVIDGIDTVRVLDIPMDGNVHYFPKADGSEIFTKRWLPNGTTEIVSYLKKENVVEEKEEFDFKTMEESILDKLNGIDERIIKLEKGLNPKTNNRNSKEG